MVVHFPQDPHQPVGWRLYPGGYLGHLFAGYTVFQAMFLTPAGELWVAAWAHQENFLLTYRAAQWIHHPNQGGQFGPFAWYRQQLWTGRPAPMVLNQGQWRVSSVAAVQAASAIGVDGGGLLWLGSEQGLWRSPDGLSWAAVALPESSKGVAALCTDATAGVWIAEHADYRRTALIHRWDSDSKLWQTLPPPAKRGIGSVTALLASAAGELWAASDRKGVFRWAGGAWRNFTSGRKTSASVPRLPSNTATSLAEDARGRIWAGTSAGLAVYDEGNWFPVVVAPEPSVKGIGLQAWMPVPTGSGHLDRGGRLWFGTYDGHIGWIDTTRDHYVEPMSLIKTSFTPMAEPLIESGKSPAHRPASERVTEYEGGR